MLNLLFPRLCHGCQHKLLRNEMVLCGKCRHSLPMQCHHLTNDVAMKSIFSGRVQIDQATALLQFHKKGLTQQLLHDLKYRKHEHISYFLGKWLGADLAESTSYKSIDLVVPVPIHKKKKKERGYNQVTGFGKEIAAALHIPYVDDVLLKSSATISQVFKKRTTRFTNENLFTITNTHKISDKHVLVVDDIITTGATLESCATLLLANGASKISLATMAITL